MDNNSIFLTQKKFDEIWGRVTNSSPTDADTLKTLMSYEYTDYNIYRTLAQRLGGEMRTYFYAMANDEKRHFRMLHGAYYILTGEIYIPEKPKKLNFDALSSLLKERYTIELEAAAGYLKAAETAKPDLAELFRANAEDEKRHARTALYLLVGVIK